MFQVVKRQISQNPIHVDDHVVRSLIDKIVSRVFWICSRHFESVVEQIPFGEVLVIASRDNIWNSSSTETAVIEVRVSQLPVIIFNFKSKITDMYDHIEVFS